MSENRKIFSRSKQSQIRPEEEAALEAFEKMNAETLAGFEAESEIPTVSAKKKDNPLPLYGYYGEAFFGAKVSAELMEKEQHRYFDNGDSSEDDLIAQAEEGLCAKYGIIPPTKWPNRRGDRGTTGEQLMIIGQTVNDRRHPRLWGIRQEDRTRHVYTIGGSGSGKSTLLHAIGVEDMWYWRGGLLMEPHGDLAMSLLRTAPPYRLHDIIYLNVLDQAASPGFNPLELPLDATDEQRAEATGSVTTLISKHFNMDATKMPRLAKMLTNALNALSWVPGATLLEIMDFYVNEDIRNSVLSFVPDGPQKDAMRDLGENAKTEDLATLENRISRFTTNRFMKHLFGQSHTTLDFFRLMNEGKYIICPASKGGTSDDTFLKFYGSYIVSEIYKSAVMRESIEEDDRVNFALTLDEFQNFLSDDVEGILSESRKYGLSMMLANQYLDQLTNPIRAAVLQNCATKLCYNLGPTDAPTMAKAFGYGLKAEDMQSIPKYHVMAAPLIMGGPVKPFISAVFPPISLKSDVSHITSQLIMDISRDKYMTPRDDIDKEIINRKERLASGNQQAIIELVTKKNH